MSSSKISAEDQMGSGESDDEFYKVNIDNLNKNDAAGKDPAQKNESPKRTKVQYDYKFDSSTDNDSDDSSTKNLKSEKIKSADSNNGNGKAADQTSKVDEKTDEEPKFEKNEPDKAKKDIAGAGILTSTKLVPSSSACVPSPSPVVVVPQPIIVSQTHSVMAMASAGMLVPPAIGLANQNVMIPPPNILNLPGNVIRAPNAVGGIMAAAPGAAVMSMGNPNMIAPIQNQGGVLGMTNDILQLQGNIIGLAGHGNLMPMPGLCVAGNMIPVQGALPGNLMRFPGPNPAMANQTIINNQATMMANPGTMMSPGGVMINTGSVMTVTNVMGNQPNMIGNTENLMLSMNNLGARMNYPGNVLGGQGISNASNALVGNSAKDVKKLDSQTQITPKEWNVASNTQCKAKPLKNKKNNQNTWQASDQVDEDKNIGIGKNGEDDDQEEDVEDEEEEDDEDRDDVQDNEDDRKPVVKESANTFKNDGSFMEMFKKMSEANNSKASSNQDENAAAQKKEQETAKIKRPSVLISGIVGKRRGGRVLKTGLVKKVRKDSENEDKAPKDAWAVYMAEVKKYREASCEEEGKTRPLVK